MRKPEIIATIVTAAATCLALLVGGILWLTDTNAMAKANRDGVIEVKSIALDTRNELKNIALDIHKELTEMNTRLGRIEGRLTK